MKLIAVVKQSNGFIHSVKNAMDDDDVTVYEMHGYSTVPLDHAIDPQDYRYNFTTGHVELKTAIPYRINKTSILADGQDTAVITDLPLQISVRWDDYSRSDLPDGEPIEFVAHYPGVYSLVLTSPIHLPTEVVIEANS